MCGRYYVDDETIRKIRELVQKIDVKSGVETELSEEIFPSQTAWVITADKEGLEAKLYRWGFPAVQKKGVIFNARSETVLEKKMFRDSILSRRCVIPAGKFYEWNREKEKYTFERTDGEPLYLAGFYRAFPDGMRFVILTTKANESMCPVHERMPLILERDQLEDWLRDEKRARGLLSQIPVKLEKYTDYEQQTLDLW